MVTGGSAPEGAEAADPGCEWWNLACQGGTEIANSGLSAITRSTASGAQMLLGQIVKIIDESTQVPLADPTYQEIYYGFLGLAAPLIGVILCGALIVASLRRQPATLARAAAGVVVAALGGALYIGFAQLLVALDDWLAHGIVRVTGRDLTQSMSSMADGFENIAGAPGEIAANMLLIILMFIMLLAGLILWFVLVLRKIAILVVVAFAPLLIAGYLWAPTRSWVRKATEVLVALIFTKSAIYALFGVGLSLLARGGGQTLSEFVGTVVLLCGACFTPLLMLRLVHFAGDTHLAGDMMGNLRGGMQPVLNRMPHGRHSTHGRADMARQQSQASRPSQGQGKGQGKGPQEPAHATGLNTKSPTAKGPASGGKGVGPGSTGTGSGGAAAGSRGAGAGSGAGAAGPVGLATGGVLAAGQTAASTAKTVGSKAAQAGSGFAAETSRSSGSTGDGSAASDPTMHGPPQAPSTPPPPSSEPDESGGNS